HFFFQAEDGIRDFHVTGVQTCALPIFRIGYQLIPNGDLIVKDQGWLEQALPDTKIIWSRFDSGGDVNTAMLSGAIDIGLAGSSQIGRAACRGGGADGWRDARPARQR